jgi:hypothetical protein
MSQQPVHCQLLETFHHVSSAIHQILHQRKCDSTDGTSDDDGWSDEGKSECEEENHEDVIFKSNAYPVIEHGVLVNCSIPSATRDKGFIPPSLNYWIIGCVSSIFVVNVDSELFIY